MENESQPHQQASKETEPCMGNAKLQATPVRKPQRLPEALDEYAHRNTARFHMPGHKGRGMGGFFRPELIGWDITELSVSDDLQNPEESIAKAQDACAACYGAAHTFFLVNGATAGILALLLSLKKGSRVLVGRDCHRAVLSGIALSGLSCSFLMPAFVETENMAGCVTAEALALALMREHAEAIWITSPNYYGLCADIPALAKVAHAHGAKLFVDAAHGAHFPFSSSLPDTPAGHADAWVNSAHKTLNALGQAAMLHVAASMDIAAVQRTLSLVQTSSPSYLLLASLDWARYTAELPGVWTHTCTQCAALAGQMANVLGVRALTDVLVGRAGIAALDVTRLVLDVSERGITGYAAQAALESQDIFIEMADQQRLVCICTPADDPAWYQRLRFALQRMPYGFPVVPPGRISYPELEAALPVHEAVYAQAELCRLNEAAGRVAVQAAGVYPPGIPLWVPGTRICEESIRLLMEQQREGASLFGVNNGMVAVVR